MTGSHPQGITFSGSGGAMLPANKTPGDSDFAGKGHSLRNKIFKDKSVFLGKKKKWMKFTISFKS